MKNSKFFIVYELKKNQENLCKQSCIQNIFWMFKVEKVTHT